MAKGLVTDTYLSDIADAIRTKNGTETQYKPSEMASAISSIPTSISTKARPNYVSFYQCGDTSLDISWLDVSNITNMNYMFSNCRKLTTLDVSNFDTGKVTNMYSMFLSCSSLTALDLSNWDTSKVTNMGSMFQSCSSLTALDLSNWDTSKVTNMGSMFSGCSLLATLDISSMNTQPRQAGMIFSSCGSKLETPTTVYVKDEVMQQWVLNTGGVPNNWSTANVIIKETQTTE